jgi:hypothetical protein
MPQSMSVEVLPGFYRRFYLFILLYDICYQISDSQLNKRDNEPVHTPPEGDAKARYDPLGVKRGTRVVNVCVSGESLATKER